MGQLPTDVPVAQPAPSPKILKLEEHMVPVVNGIEQDVEIVKVELEALLHFRDDVGQHVQELREWQQAVEAGTGNMFHSTNQRVQQLEEQIARMFTHLTSLEQKCNQGFGELATDTRQMREEVNAFESQMEQGVHHTALQEVTKGMREIESRLQAQSQLHDAT